jgi:DNA-binding response OmpR family regulator
MLRIAQHDPERQTASPVAAVALGAGVVLDLSARCLRIERDEVRLSCDKFELLRYLVNCTGRAVSADELVCKRIFLRSQAARYKAIVFELRRKLGPAWRSIRSVPGYGYRFEALSD